MPTLSNDNNVTVQINTKSNLSGIEETKAGLGTLNKTSEESAAKSVAWGSSFKSAGLMAGVALGGVVLVGKDMVKSFNESAQYSAQLDAVLRSTAGGAGVTRQAAIDLSRAIEHNTALSDEAVLSGENMLLTFTNIGKDIFPQTTQAVADMATAMNGGAVPTVEDMRNKAILLGKALQDPDAGLGALHRVGVNVDELKKKFTDSMSVQDKQKLILQELGKEFGGSAAAALKTHAGQVQHDKEQMDDFKESMGQLIVTALAPLQRAFEVAAPVLERFATFLTQNKVAMAALMGVLGGLAIAAIVALVLAIGWIPLALTAAAIVIGAVIGIIIAKWDEWKGWIILIGSVLTFGLLPIIIWVVSQIVSHWQTIVNGFSNAIATIKNIWNAVPGFFSSIASRFGGIFAGIASAIGGPFVSAFNLIASAWNATVGKLHFTIPSWVPGLGGKGFSVPSIPHFETGVKNFAGGLALVGEAGPELVNLPAGSTVHSNQQSQKMAGGQTRIYNDYGDKHFHTPAAVKAFFDEIDNDRMLVGKGLAPVRGAF